MKRFFLKSLLAIILIVFPLALKAGSLSDAWGGSLDTTAGEMGYTTGPGSASPEIVISLVIQAVLGFLGVIFIILVIYGGILWMTAGGNEQQVEKAQKILKNSVIGLAIVLLAYAISVFVINIFASRVV